ncbi:MAG: hypothetical protein LQ349_002140 [Xanthoria aureola]|nr:MAG: hypothetical protein LQ349_002140 [Xanthoria aureola]
MSLLASSSSSSSSSTEPPNLNWQQMSDASYWRATYSTQAREAAGKAAQDAYAAYLRGIRELEKIPSWAKPLMDKHDKAAEKSFELGKMLADAAAIEWGVGADKYKAAYNDPWTVGVRPDLACPADSAGCLARKEGGAIDVVPSPEGKGSNTLEGPSGDGERNEEDPTEKNEWPEGMDEDPDLTEPIINDDEEFLIDLEEREEKKLWDEIGSKTIDPNASTLSEEEKRAEAEFYKRLGFCDKTYYGEKGCREWKRQLDSVPMPPDAKLELESQLQGQLDLCPVNLVKLTDCQRAKESVYMRFAILDETAQAVDAKFQPGRPVDVVPRLDFLVPGRNVTASMGGLQVRPLEEEKGPSTNENLKLEPVSIPRLPGQTAPKPSTPPAKEVPRLPFDVKAFDITPSATGSDDPRIPTWDLPGKELPRIQAAPGHEVPQDQDFNPPAIGGHTVPPFRLPPQA